MCRKATCIPISETTKTCGQSMTKNYVTGKESFSSITVISSHLILFCVLRWSVIVVMLAVILVVIVAIGCLLLTLMSVLPQTNSHYKYLFSLRKKWAQQILFMYMSLGLMQLNDDLIEQWQDFPAIKPWDRAFLLYDCGIVMECHIYWRRI